MEVNFIFFKILIILSICSTENSALSQPVDLTDSSIFFGFNISRDKFGVLVKNKKYFELTTENKIDYLIDSNISLFKEYSFRILPLSENKKIVLCGEYLLYLVDRDNNKIGNSVLNYEEKDYTTLDGNSVISINDKNEILIGYQTKNKNTQTVYIQLVLFDDTNDNFKLSKTFKKEFQTQLTQGVYKIDCLFVQNGDNIFCGFLNEDMRLVYGMMSKDWELEEEEIISAISVRFILISKEKVIILSFLDFITITLIQIKLNSYSKVFDNKFEIDLDSNIGEFWVAKKDTKSFYFSANNQRLNLYEIYLFTITKNGLISEKLDSTSIVSFTSSFLIPITSSVLSLLINSNNHIYSYILTYSFASSKTCEDIVLNLTSEEIKKVEIADLCKECDSSKKINVLSYENVKIILKTSSQIILKAPSSGSASISYTLESNFNCIIQIQTCNPACSSCQKFSSDNSDTQCSACNTGYYPLERSASNCIYKNQIPNGYFLENKTVKKCYYKCKTCNGEGNLFNHNCLTCPGDYTLSNHNCVCDTDKSLWHFGDDGLPECVLSCSNLFPLVIGITKECVKECPTKYPNLAVDEKKCVTDSVCKNQYFYVDGVNKCYSSKCPSNYEYTLRDTNQCVSDCPDSSKWIIVEEKKCVSDCPVDYYMITSESSCFEKCPTTKSYVIDGERECISKCDENHSFIFEYTCFSQCPQKVQYYYNNGINEYRCIDACPDNYSLHIDQSNECVSSCPDNYKYLNLNDSTCYTACPNGMKTYWTKCVDACPQGTKEVDTKCEMIKDTVSDLINNIDDNVIDMSKNEPSGKINNSQYQIYNTSKDSQEEIEKQPNTSTIDLGDCEKKLKDYYSIDENEPLIIFKLDIERGDQLTNQVEYSVYSKEGKKLDLSICKNETILITSPINVNKDSEEKIDLDTAKDLEKEGYDMYNSSDPFYTDVCTPYTTKDNTDIPLNDRKSDIYKNVSFCETGCSYSGVNLTTMRVSCLCSAKEEVSENEKEFSFNSLKDEFSIFKNSNLKVIKCSKLVFGHSVAKNAGSWILIVVFIIEAIILVVYFVVGIKPLLTIVNEILRKKASDIEEIKRIESCQKETSSEAIELKFNPSNSEDNTVADKSIRPKIFIYNHTKKESKNSVVPVVSTNNNHTKTLDEEMTSTKTISKETKSEEFTDEEINDMSFEDSIKNDKRTFLKCYYSFLKYDQLIIFTFITSSDFNLKLLKISLFCFGFAMFLFFNTLFYTDDALSHNYKNKGKFDFLYSLPKSIFSDVFCAAVNFLLSYLSLSQSQIQKIKDEGDFGKAKELYERFTKSLKIKLVFFFVTKMVFLFFFWYYETAFCQVYRNTQKFLVIDTFTSFNISMIYPFGFCLATTIARKISIRKNLKFLFMVSKFLQIL